MSIDIEKVASDFLEISSEQRLSIIMKLFKKKSTMSQIARELDASTPEVHRNFGRLSKAGIVEKDSEGNYSLSIYGKTICEQIPSLIFVSENKKFFESHSFGDLPKKFIHRIGELNKGNHVKGFVKVLEKWKEIHDDSEKYIYNVLSEVPYSKDIIEIVENKLKNKIEIKSVFSENAIIPDERKTVFKIKNFNKYVKEDLLNRRMLKNISVVVLLNEKESCIIFPKLNGEPDMSEMFFSTDQQFHDWCLDYFDTCWKNSKSFQESKLKKE